MYVAVDGVSFTNKFHELQLQQYMQVWIVSH